MNCEQINELLSAFIDGETSPEETAAVREHLAACSGCAGELRRLTVVWEALLADKGTQPRPSFAAEFWRRAAGRQPRQSLARRLLKWSPAIAAGFAAAFIAGRMTVTTPRSLEAQPADVAFLRDYDLIEQIDLLEALPLLQADELAEGGEE